MRRLENNVPGNIVHFIYTSCRFIRSLISVDTELFKRKEKISYLNKCFKESKINVLENSSLFENMITMNIKAIRRRLLLVVIKFW